MRDAVTLNADRWVVVSRELSEEGAVALVHHDRDEVDGYLVEQPRSRHCRAMVPPVTVTTRSPARLCA